MVSVLNVTARQISNIKAPERFVELLRRLLHAEARANGIARRGISVPAQITVSDEGEDARIEWQNGPPGTDYLPARVTMFQSKATSMPRATCAKEVRNEDGTLKAAIKNALDAQGAYIIFCTDECRGNMLRERIEGIRDGISTATKNGYPGALIYFYDANKISDWVNSHPSVASWALTEIFHRPVTIFQSWESWSKNSELKATKYAYIAGRSIDGRLDLHTQFHLEHVLGAGFDKDEGRKGVLFTYSDDELLNWCREAPEVAPAFLAKIVPLLLREDDKPKFSPFVMRLLDEFGKQKDILSAIASNMHSFSSVGSRVPYYETRLKALESLLTHRHKEVRDFARKEIAALKTQIEHERKRDQEHDFGIF